MNITVLHPEISHIVVMSGFVSVEMLINSMFGGHSERLLGRIGVGYVASGSYWTQMFIQK